MGNSNKPTSYYIILVILSILVALSPIILVMIYAGLDYIGIMPLPDGIGALSFAMIVTVPAGVITFVVGIMLLIWLNIRRKNLREIKEHYEKTHKAIKKDTTA